MAEKRISIPIDSTPIVEFNTQVALLQKRYTELKKSSNDLAKAVKNGAVEQKEALEKSNKELKETGDQLTAILTNGKRLEKEQPFEKMAKGSQTVRQELNVIRREMQHMVLNGEQGTEEFKRMGERVGELRGALSDSQTAFIQFEQAGSNSTAGISRGFTDMARSLATLDFNQATQGVNAMSNSLENLDVDAMSKNILTFSKAIGGTLVQSLKTVGKTIVGVGKAILANPIFLIAAVIVGVIAAVVKLADHFGILGDIIDTLAKPFTWLMSLLDKLTDYIGLTNHAEQKLADDRARRAEEESKRITEENDLKKNSLARQVQILEAKGDLTEEEKQQIFELKRESLEAELEKQESLRATADAQYKALATKRNLTDEEKEQLEELRVAWVGYGEAIKDVQADIVAGDVKHASDITRARKAEVEKQLEIDRAAWEKRKAEIQRQQEEEAKLREDAAKFVADIIERTKLSAIENENLRTLEATKIALKKEQDDILLNTQLTEEQKSQIKEYYRGLENQAENDYRKKVNEEELNATSQFEEMKLQHHLALLEQNAETSLQANLEYQQALHEQDLLTLQNQYEELRAEYERQGLDTLELDNLFLDQRLALEEAYNDNVEVITKDRIDAIAQAEREAQKDLLGNTASLFSSIGGLMEEGSAAQKGFALANIIASQAEALAGAIPLAISAASATGPAAPFVFASTLAGIGVSIIASIANAKKVLSTSSAKGSSGGGTPSIAAPTLPVENNEVSLYKNNSGLDSNNTQGKTMEIPNQTTEVKVSISEINEVNNKVSNYEKASEL